MDQDKSYKNKEKIRNLFYKTIQLNNVIQLMYITNSTGYYKKEVRQMKKYEVPECEIIKFDVDDKTMYEDVDGDTVANPWGDLFKDPASGNI